MLQVTQDPCKWEIRSPVKRLLWVDHQIPARFCLRWVLDGRAATPSQMAVKVEWILTGWCLVRCVDWFVLWVFGCFASKLMVWYLLAGPTSRPDVKPPCFGIRHPTIPVVLKIVSSRGLVATPLLQRPNESLTNLKF